jgi:hypothetical protein
MKRCHAILILVIATFSGCSFRSAYPTIGAVVGGSVGTVAGGPVVGGLSAGAGALAGEALKNKDALLEAEETIDLLSHGDVDALMKKSFDKHQSGFEEFTSYIKKILIIAACILAVYLSIPIFVARKTAETCSKTAAEKHLTRAPFPTNEKL